MVKGISIANRRWAEELHLPAVRIEEMRQKMLTNQKEGRYIFYDGDINEMDAAEVIFHHTQMVNYLIDARTHCF